MHQCDIFWKSLGIWALAAVCTVAIPPPTRAQIPVIDGSAILKHIEQIVELKKQLETAQQQLGQLQSLHQSLNRMTDMGDIASLLNNPSIRAVLPKEFSQLEAALKGHGNGAAGANTGSYQEQNTHYSRDGDDFYASATKRAQDGNAGQAGIAQQVYDAASKRMDGLEQLRSQIGRNEDPKSVLDLQARIQTESAHLQNDLLKMQALRMLQQAELQTREQREREEWDRRTDQNIRAFGGTSTTR